MKATKWISTLVVSLLVQGTTAAITIDDFEEGDLSIEVGQSGVSTSATADSDSALGGGHTNRVTQSSGIGAIASEINGGLLSHSQTAQAQGESSVTWTLTNTIDITEDIAQSTAGAFTVRVLSFDQPAQSSVTITIEVKGSSDSVSELSNTLTSAISSPETILFPFSDFQAQAGKSAANLAAVSEITLTITGNKPGIDVSIETFGTNGQCSAVPAVNQNIIDECGVCGGDNSSCVDCLGVPNGAAVPGSSCNTGESGACGAGVYSGTAPNCSCIQTNVPSGELCDEIDNDCDGEVDESFPQLGTSCSAGDDACKLNGIFQCDNSGGIRCGTEEEAQTVENCEANRGCDDIPFSGLIEDDCGVCGGDGTSCQDCAGVPNGPALLDECGRCGGLGESCCEDFDITETQLALTGGIKRQERVLNRTVRTVLRRLNLDAIQAGRFKSIQNRAERLRGQAVPIPFQLPSIFSTCESQFCTTASNASVLREYRKKSKRIQNLMILAVRRANRVALKEGDPRRVSRRFIRRARTLHNQNILNLEKIPGTRSSCEIPN